MLWLIKFVDGLSYKFFVLFSDRFWLFDVAKGGENLKVEFI